jgi:hypothetical protein
MKNNKNLWIGLGIVVVIVAIILAVTLSGNKKEVATPEVVTPAPTTETKKSAYKKPTNTAVLKFVSPTEGATVVRGTAYTVSWTGTEDCYDLGYSLDPLMETPYNFIGKACKDKMGMFSYVWNVPINTTPGTYGFELRNSGSKESIINSPSFNIQ